jgi:hypothetical protein
MTNRPLSRINKINPRDCWPHEALDFTPWLAEDDNIAHLSETLGLTGLTVEQTEVQVGPFRADILCREVGTEGYVLIENQLERTDHTHLGQIMTYAAGLDAAKIIWISPQFTEEHRAALDWLNSITGDNFHFFGIQLELWQIADSPLAPRFEIIAKPNDWTKLVRGGTGRSENRNTSERAQAYAEWWGSLFRFLEENNAGFQLGSGYVPSGSWVYVAGVPAHNRICVSYARIQDQANVYILFRDKGGKKMPEAAQWYRHAKANAADFLDQLGPEATWIDDGDMGYLCLSRSVGENREQCFRWILENVPRLQGWLEEVHGKLST